jgi:hypothetical protein
MKKLCRVNWLSCWLSHLYALFCGNGSITISKGNKTNESAGTISAVNPDSKEVTEYSNIDRGQDLNIKDIVVGSQVIIE